MRVFILVFVISILIAITTAVYLPSSPIKTSSIHSQYDRILVVIAHPDDLECICGGLIALQAKGGAAIGVVVVTSGDKGYGKDNTTSPYEVSVIREQEQRKAGAVLGISYFKFLRFPDGGLEAVDPIELKRLIVVEIRTFRPSLVVTFRPDIDVDDYAWAYRLGVIHRDHLVVGRITLDAVYPAARNYRSFPDAGTSSLPGYIVPMVYLFAFNHAPLVVDITSVINIKISAVLQHQSQYTDPKVIASFIYSLGQNVSNSSSSSYQYAEGYIPTPMP